jgi:uncharacterized protein YegL
MSSTSLVLQSPFIADVFAENPEPRCPCVLVLDTSGSMEGRPLTQLNAGYQTLLTELLEDALAAKRVELAVVTFGPVKLVQDFETPDMIAANDLDVTGDTPMGEAIEFAIDLVKQRKDVYREAGIAYYRPWIFVITDGSPTDSWKAAARAVKEGEASNAFSLFAVGVEGADMETLKQIAVREPIRLKGLRFAELFRWLSNSLKSVSRSTTTERVALPAPTGWAEV